MIEAGAIRRDGEQCGRDDHLQAAEAEDQPPHGQEPRQRQFKPDQEQQKDDAKLGNAGDILGVADRDPVERRKRRDQRAQAQRPQ